LVVILGGVACVSSKGARRDTLPSDWITALPASGTRGADVAGAYVELGQQLDAHYTRNGIIGPANLSTFLASKTLGSSTVRRPAGGGATVELRRVDDTHFELITRVDGAVTDRFAHESETEKDTGTMVLHRNESLPTDGAVLVAGYVRFNFRLWRGADGRLYAHGTRRAVASVMLLPAMVSNEVWYRWDPATSEALARQAAALAAP